MTIADVTHSSGFDPKLRDYHACEQLCYAFARCLDFFDHDSLPELFVEDGELEIDSEHHRGRRALLACAASFPRLPTRHVVSNVFIDFIDSDNARGISYIQRLSAENTQLTEAAGHFEDRYARRDGQWHFARRRLHWLNPS